MLEDQKPMWSSIHHDRNNDRMFVWYTNGDRKAYNVKHRFYTPNRGEFGSYSTGMKDIYGKDMYEVIVDGKTEQDIRNERSGRHNDLSEIDVDFRTRWLQSQYQNHDEIRFDMADINICFLDIEVATKGRFPTAEKAEYPINCVTIYFSKLKKYYTFGLNRDLREDTYNTLRNNNCEYINCPNERNLITELFTKIGENNVDILTGWNADFYDFPYLVNRAEKLGISLKLLSRLPGQYKSAYVSKRTNVLEIGGTETIDFLKLYRKFTFSERDNYKLDTIGKVEVNEQKAPLPDGYMSYIKYWDEFVLYNFQDVRLMVRIEEVRKMFETTVTACSEARVPFSAIFEAKKMLVGFLLNFLHKKNLVMPPLREYGREWFPGAYVYSTPGYYESLVSYDYRSMYPSIMMGANISPETKVTYPIDAVIPEGVLKNLVRSPWTANGTRQVFYRKDIVGIVPEVVRILFDGRTALKNLKKKAEKEGRTIEAQYYDMKQQTYKILGNSLYGLLGNPFFQLYDIDNSASITAFGRELIMSTVKELNEYMEKDFESDPKYVDIFGEKPYVNPARKGTFEQADHTLAYNRVSHGDTDSFFVKYDDFYASFKTMVGKHSEIVVFKGDKIISKNRFDLPNGEEAATARFTQMCAEFSSDWDKMDAEKKAKMVADGILMSGEYRIIYNRFYLTDYCRMLDAGLMEEKLAGIMLNYANRWNYYENTLFLKREKCIHQAIVTAKKKYICRVESNEDIVYLDKKTNERKAKFAITGLEIVRSSTTPFARERILDMIDKMLKNMDRSVIRKEYLKVKNDFYQMIEDRKFYDISIPSGVKNDPPKYTAFLEMPSEQQSKVDWRLRSASVWNHLIETDPVLSTLPLEPIFEAAKVKFIKVAPNKYGITSIAYVGNECPERLFDIFTPDWDEQWLKTFAQTMDRLFEAIGWGTNFEHDETSNLMEFL